MTSKPAALIGNYCSNSALDKGLLFGSLRETHNLRTYAMLTSSAKNLHPRQLPAWTSSTEQKPAGGSTFDPVVAQKVRLFRMSAHMSWQLEGRYCDDLSIRSYMAPKPAKLQRGGPPTYGFYYDAPGGVTVEVSTMNIAEPA